MDRPGKEPDAARKQRSVSAVDPLANLAQAKAALARPMSERLELALSWNAMASELRAGLPKHETPPREDEGTSQ